MCLDLVFSAQSDSLGTIRQHLEALLPKEAPKKEARRNVNGSARRKQLKIKRGNDEMRS